MTKDTEVKLRQQFNILALQCKHSNLVDKALNLIECLIVEPKSFCTYGRCPFLKGIFTR